MKLVWKRDYNIKNRLYIEGLYLNDAGFCVDNKISYSINKCNNYAILKIAKSSENKVTHNISRSGKIVPTIGIKNKMVESFINENENMELFVFRGIIVLLSRDNTNKNIALCEALIVKNKEINEGIRRIFKILIAMGLLEDVDLIDNGIDKQLSYDLSEKNAKLLSTKLISKHKQKLWNKKINIMKCKKRSFFRKSNSYILCVIVKSSCDKHAGDIDLQENDLLEFLAENYCCLTELSNEIESYFRKKIIVDGTKFNVVSGLIKFQVNYKKSDRLMAILKFYIKSKISCINNLVMIRFKYLERYYLINRKQTKTLSPPFIKYF